MNACSYHTLESREEPAFMHNRRAFRTAGVAGQNISVRSGDRSFCSTGSAVYRCGPARQAVRRVRRPPDSTRRLPSLVRHSSSVFVSED